MPPNQNKGKEIQVTGGTEFEYASLLLQWRTAATQLGTEFYAIYNAAIDQSYFERVSQTKNDTSIR
jgi:hypothetical protein